MSKLPYHRRNHREFLNGGKLLDNELYGAYSRICDLIYDNEGPIDDDAVWIAGVMRCSTRRYRTIRDTLIEHGKIEVIDGRIHNKRCRKELEFLSNFSRTQAERASNTDRKSREKKASSAKINDLTEAAAQPTETYTETEKKESPSLRSGDSLAACCSARATQPPEPVWRTRLAEVHARHGDVLNLTVSGTQHFAVLRNLCEPGTGSPCDWERDVTPALDALAAQFRAKGALLNSFALVKPMAVRNRDHRLAGLPPMEIPHEPTRATAGRGRGPASHVAAGHRLLARLERGRDDRPDEFDERAPAAARLLAAG